MYKALITIVFILIASACKQSEEDRDKIEYCNKIEQSPTEKLFKIKAGYCISHSTKVHSN